MKPSKLPAGYFFTILQDSKWYEYRVMRMRDTCQQELIGGGVCRSKRDAERSARKQIEAFSHAA